ncbi:MAG: hypothetical protein QXX09_04900, partial [Candidatus Methanomethylicia archaeon]
AEIFFEYDMAKLGCIYCYVDPAKSMTINPNRKVIHSSCVLAGDPYCSFETLETTTSEKNAFKNNSIEWRKVDPKLYETIFKEH